MCNQILSYDKPVFKDSVACLLKWPEFFQDNFLSWLDLICWLGEVVEFCLLIF